MVNLVIEFKGKHGSRLFDGSTPKLIAQACTKILRERQDEGWFWRSYEKPYQETLDKENKAILTLTEEELEGLPDVLREPAVAKQKALVAKELRYNQEKASEDEFFQLLALVLATPVEEVHELPIPQGFASRRISSLPLALIDARGDYEYEEYDIIELES